MKSARTGAFVFAFVVLMGGYLMHQYCAFTDAKMYARWREAMLPATVGFGWLLLIAAIGLAFTRPDEEQP